MPIRKYKPTSAGRRFQSVQTFDEITTDRPYKPLIEPLDRSGGRNNLMGLGPDMSVIDVNAAGDNLYSFTRSK